MRTYHKSQLTISLRRISIDLHHPHEKNLLIITLHPIWGIYEVKQDIQNTDLLASRIFRYRFFD